MIGNPVLDPGFKQDNLLEYTIKSKDIMVKKLSAKKPITGRIFHQT